MAYWASHKLELQLRQSELIEWFRSISDDTPLPHAYDETITLYHKHEEHGTMMVSGGWLDQPDYMVEDFLYYDLMFELFGIPEQLALCERRIQGG